MTTVIDNTTPAPTVKGSTLAVGQTVGNASGKFFVINIGTVCLLNLEGDNAFGTLTLDPSADFTVYPNTTVTINP